MVEVTSHYATEKNLYLLPEAVMSDGFRALANRIRAQDGGYSDLEDVDLSKEENPLAVTSWRDIPVVDFSYDEFKNVRGQESIIRWHGRDGKKYFVEKDKNPKLFEAVSDYRKAFTAIKTERSEDMVEGWVTKMKEALKKMAEAMNGK
jgi:hypothetical protein